MLLDAESSLIQEKLDELIKQRYDELIENSIEEDLCSELKGAYYLFEPNRFNSFELPVLMDYLRKTHGLYLLRRIPELQQTFDLIKKVSDPHDLELHLAQVAFHRYINAIVQHITEEESGLLGAIDKLSKGRKLEKPEILDDFIQDHHDNEIYLKEFLLLIENMPSEKARLSLMEVLKIQIKILATDLSIHARIEEGVVLEKAKELHRKLCT